MASVFWDVIDGYSDLMEKRGINSLYLNNVKHLNIFNNFRSSIWRLVSYELTVSHLGTMRLLRLLCKSAGPETDERPTRFWTQIFHYPLQYCPSCVQYMAPLESINK